MCGLYVTRLASSTTGMEVFEQTKHLFLHISVYFSLKYILFLNLRRFIFSIHILRVPPKCSKEKKKVKGSEI